MGYLSRRRALNTAQGTAGLQWLYDLAWSHRVMPRPKPYDAAPGGVDVWQSGLAALEMAQCLAERRHGGETGVASVQCLTGEVFWEALRSGSRWSRDLETAALAVAQHGPGTPRDHYAARFAQAHQAAGAEGVARRESSEPAIFLIEHRDGLRVSVLMLNGYVTQRGAAVRVRGESEPLAACFTQARQQPLWHFDHQADYIERLIETGAEPYPVERSLLTTGMVDAVMTSRFEGGRRLETPHLDVVYASLMEPPFHVRSFTVPRPR